MRYIDGRYRLDAPVGCGGMAEVWRAHDLVLRRAVAIKLLTTDHAGAGYSSAVRREAIAMADLSDPRITRVFDYGECEEGGRNLPYLVMEFVTGPTLASRITGGGAIAWPEALSICGDIAGALAAAHSRSLVHRDIKPRNVILSPVGVKVVDFGSAALSGQDPADEGGRVWGTVAYLAPEQLDHGRAVPAGDMYALGIVLYQCLAGRLPWKPGAPAEVLAQRRLRPRPQLPVVPGLPTAVVDLYRRCMSAAPEARPSAHEAERILRTAATLAPPSSADDPTVPLATSPPQADPTVSRARATRRTIAVILVFTAVLLLARVLHLTTMTSSDPAVVSRYGHTLAEGVGSRNSWTS